MDSQLISSLIYDKCPKLSYRFMGCFPCNTFPPLNEPGQFQIVNTDPDTAAGRHWVLIGHYRAHQLLPPPPPPRSRRRRPYAEEEEERVNKHKFKQSIFYFDSLDTTSTSTSHIKNIPYACVRDRLSSFYYGRGGGGGGGNVEILKPINFGITPQNKQTSTCGLYCIYMAHIIYLDAETNYVTEDGILQFAQEHFNKKFIKHFLYL